MTLHDGASGPLTEAEKARLQEQRAFFFAEDGQPRFADDQPSDGTVGALLGQISEGRARCRCLVCPCMSIRTVEHPVLCRECTAGSHSPTTKNPLGGVL